jgi:cysteine desulfurase
VGKLPINVKELGVDLLSLSGHKFHAPKGIGALYVKKGTRIQPLLYGGGHEKNRRAGTENVPQIVALGRAAQMAMASMEATSQHVSQLRDYFEAETLKRIPLAYLNGSPSGRTPNTSNIRFEHVESEAMVINLDLAGVACSTGSACASGSIEPSHVLIAMGLSHEQAFGSIRFSLSKNSTREEISCVLDLLPGIVQRLREMSTRSNKSFTMVS